MSTKLTTAFGCPVADNQNVLTAGALFRLTPAQQRALFDNTARSISGVPREIQLRHVRHCTLADPGYGSGIAKALGIRTSEVG